MNVNFCYRKACVNLPMRKLVPAHVVHATTGIADVQTTSADKTTLSPATSADTAASAAVAAVLASQTYMKVCFCLSSCYLQYYVDCLPRLSFV